MCELLPAYGISQIYFCLWYICIRRYLGLTAFEVYCNLIKIIIDKIMEKEENWICCWLRAAYYYIRNVAIIYILLLFYTIFNVRKDNN